MARLAASTHASRNPTKKVQTSRRRGRPSGKLTPSQVATRLVQITKRKTAKMSLEKDLDEVFANQDAVINELVAKHKKTKAFITSLITNPSRFKQTRTVNLRNAILHDLHLKSKADGTKLTLRELNSLADQVKLKPKSNPADKAEVQRLKKQLADNRAHKSMGLRASNLAASADARAVVSRCQHEFMTLYERTGTRAIALFTRGHIDDGFIPTYAESGGSMEFFLQTLKVAGIDVLRFFEHWSCVQDRKKAPVEETLSAMRRQIKLYVGDGLEEMTKHKDLSMSYKHYLVNIMQPWKVKVVGYPDDIPFVNPSELGTIARTRMIRDGWRSGDIHWEYLTAEEAVEVTAEVERRRLAGTLPGRKKRRSDAGKKHRRAKRDDDEDEGHASDEEEDDEEDEPSMARKNTLPTATSTSHPTPTTVTPVTAHLQVPPAAASTVIDLGRRPGPDLHIPFDASQFDFSGMATLDFDTLAASFGSGAFEDPGLDALVALNAIEERRSMPPPIISSLFMPGAAPGAEPTRNAAPEPMVTGLFMPGAPPAAVLPAAAPIPTNSSLSQPRASASSMQEHASPLAPANISHFQFSAPATPANFLGPQKKRRGAKEAATAGKPPRKVRSDAGKKREVKAVAVLTPEEKEKRLAARKLHARRKAAALDGRTI